MLEQVFSGSTMFPDLFTKFCDCGLDSQDHHTYLGSFHIKEKQINRVNKDFSVLQAILCRALCFEISVMEFTSVHELMMI